MNLVRDAKPTISLKIDTNSPAETAIISKPSSKPSHIQTHQIPLHRPECIGLTAFSAGCKRTEFYL